jgi:hypothetical protein
METFDWESHIREWSRKRLEVLEDYEKERLPPSMIEDGYLGYSGAAEEEIAAAEARLGVTFPSSYREFLKVILRWTVYTKSSCSTPFFIARVGGLCLCSYTLPGCRVKGSIRLGFIIMLQVTIISY